jgi:hypothetical protein
VNLNKDKQQHLRSDRRYFRLETEIPCEVGPAGGEMNVALIRDLSCGGVKFSCNQHSINNMFPNDQAPLGVVLDVYINIHFNLSADGERETVIKTGARVIHTERLAQDLYQVGAQFIDLTEKAIKNLETFIGATRLA